MGVILNDKDREQNHAQSEDIQLDTVQNSTIGVDASAADLLHALSSKAPKQIKQKPVIDAKQVLSETGYFSATPHRGELVLTGGISKSKCRVPQRRATARAVASWNSLF